MMALGGMGPQLPDIILRLPRRMSRRRLSCTLLCVRRGTANTGVAIRGTGPDCSSTEERLVTVGGGSPAGSIARPRR